MTLRNPSRPPHIPTNSSFPLGDVYSSNLLAKPTNFTTIENIEPSSSNFILLHPKKGAYTVLTVVVGYFTLLEHWVFIAGWMTCQFEPGGTYTISGAGVTCTPGVVPHAGGMRFLRESVVRGPLQIIYITLHQTHNPNKPLTINIVKVLVPLVLL